MKNITAKKTPLNNSLPPLGANDPQVSGSVTATKESEPAAATPVDSFAEEKKLIAQIRSAEDVVDKEAIAIVEKEISDIKQSHPQPKLPPDVEDAGVISPQAEADKVITDGPSLTLPIDEQVYKMGHSMPAKGKWHYYEKEVVGVKSLVAMALWVARLIKVAHKHAKKIIFKKPIKSSEIGGDKGAN